MFPYLKYRQTSLNLLIICSMANLFLSLLLPDINNIITYKTDPLSGAKQQMLKKLIQILYGKNKIAEKKDNRFLIISGRIMINIGGIALILVIGSFLLIAAIEGTVKFVAKTPYDPVQSQKFSNMVISTLLIPVFEIVTGVIGVVNAAKPEKALLCIVFGLLNIIVTIVVIIKIFTTPPFPEFSLEHILYILISLSVPICYLIGAFKNKTLARSGYTSIN